MTGIISVLIFLLILTLIVSLHELGHLVSAKKFGVYCREYAIGMGPAIWKRKKPGQETQFSIRAFPMGGYVQMVGEDGEAFSINPTDQVWLMFNAAHKVEKIYYTQPDTTSEAVEVVAFQQKQQPMTLTYRDSEGEHTVEMENLVTCYDSEKSEEYLVAKNRQFTSLPPLKKIVVLCAGVFVNFVLGFVLIFASTWITGVNVEPIIATDTIQSQNGFLAGDVITSVNNQQFAELDDLTTYIRTHPGEVVEVEIQRQGQQMTVTRTIQTIEAQELNNDGIQTITYGALGITYQRSHHHLAKILAQSWASFTYFFTYVYFVLKGLFSGSIGITNFTGFIGIAQQTNAVITQATTTQTIGAQFLEVFGRLCSFTAFLSVNIGVMNILPFPALDGGRVVFALYELIFRKRPNPKFEMYMNAAGMMLLLGLFVMITFMDIKRLFG